MERSRHYIFASGSLLALVFAFASSGTLAQTSSGGSELPTNPNELVPSIKTSDDFGFDAVSGQISYSFLMGGIGSEGRGLVLSLTHLATPDAALRPATYSTEVRLTSSGDGNLVVNGMGLSATFYRTSFTQNSSGTLTSATYQSVMDKAQSLVFSSGVHTFTDRDGTVVVFDGSSATSITYPNGNRITFVGGVQNSFGFAIKKQQVGSETQYIFYNKAEQSSSSSDYSRWNVAKVNFSQASGFFAARYTNIEGNYFYPVYTEFVTTIHQGGFTQSTPYVTKYVSNFEPDTVITYGQGAPTQGASGSQTWYARNLTKGALSFDYISGWAFSYGGYSATISGGRKNSSGQTQFSVSANWSGPGSIPRINSSFNGHATTSYTWSEFVRGQSATHHMTSVTAPEGNSVSYTRDARDNIIETRTKAKPGSSLPDIITRATFPSSCTSSTRKTCNKPVSVTDANGNVTNFEYSTTHGGMTKRTLPADANGIRPQTRYSYAQKYAWLKSGSSYVRAATPVWVLVSEEFCKTTAASGSGCAGGASDEVVTTYQYQEGSSSRGSNLLLLGTAVTADGQTLRTCYRYDDQGRQISETQPKAGLSTCPA